MATETTLAPSNSSNMPVRSVSPGERTQYCSNTGLDIEAQIADGGGVAAMRASEGDRRTPGTGAGTQVQTSKTSRRDKSRDEEEIPMARLVRCFGGYPCRCV